MSKGKRLKRLKLLKEVKEHNYQGLPVIDIRNNPGKVSLIIKSLNSSKGSRYFKPSHSMTGISYNADAATVRAHREYLMRFQPMS